MSDEVIFAENSGANKIQRKGKRKRIIIPKKTLDNFEKPYHSTHPQKKEDIEMIKMETPILSVPKVVGKIDLDSINAKKKPRKKSKDELFKEKAERNLIEKEKREKLRAARRAKERAEQEESKKQFAESVISCQDTEQEKKSDENKPNIIEKLSKIIRTFFQKYKNSKNSPL